MLHNTKDNNPLTLFCLVDGEPQSNVFSVKATPTDTVDDLKKLIKAEKTPRFDDVAADELTLWRVSIPVVPANKHKPIVLNEFESATELDPTDDVSDVFPEAPPKKTIHVIVQRPPQERLEKDVFHADTSISRFLHSFVKGDLSIPDADCCVKGLPRTWLRSRTFAQESTQPALYLLHPRRPHQTTATPPSVTALHTIKKFQNNDMITFFGVSGCGKTRAVVEMLAQNWGFYLNGSQADRGSKDVTTLF
ncbi:hypothetical protein BGZ97_009677, partial [Linnemannia gamsii]